MTNDVCEICDFIGPELPTLMTRDARELHRAVHDLGRTVRDALHLMQLIAWIEVRLTR